jgi:hypothetical protein
LVVLALRLTIRELAQSTLHLLHELTTQPKIQEFSPKSGTAPKSDLIAPLPSHFPADSQLPLAMVQDAPAATPSKNGCFIDLNNIHGTNGLQNALSNLING